MAFQNYMIFAHKNPLQLGQMVAALDSGHAWFFVHIDKATDQHPFEVVLKDKTNVTFLAPQHRFNTLWGHMNMVKATLASMDYVIRANHSGVAILMSGLDYPVKSRQHIEKYLTENKEKCLIAAEPLLKGNDEEDIFTTRLNHYRINLSNNYICFPSVFDRAFYRRRRVHDIYRVMKYGSLSSLLKLFKRRRHPDSIVPYWGSQWWVLPFGVLKEIDKFVKNNSTFVNYHENSLLPDEIFFQTVLKQIHHSGQADLVFADRCMFMTWDEGAASPNFFGEDDVPALMSLPGHFLFARKFDNVRDPGILDIIDSKISDAVWFKNP